MRLCFFIPLLVAAIAGSACKREVQQSVAVSVEKNDVSARLSKPSSQSSTESPSEQNLNVEEGQGSADSAEVIKQKQLAKKYDDELENALNGPRDAERVDFGGPTKLRNSHVSCIKRSGGATPDLLDCDSEEYKYQDSRLNRVYRSVMAQLDAAKKQELLSEERVWIVKRDQLCNLNGQLGGGQAEDIEESSCRLNATARRADELEKRQASK
ncbi:lysozyme inhibitor LprI family protein [Xanthomonas nasturtii]|uniref:Lysozyme inhibitor LprI family protein n=1 Tax=Xanthomonas nasturtii TaxID=1843581 RepID=A0ABT0LU38_9XANT|nr:lysozyme inhibitor LprI family protein [Xanthomonas nasturtii]MCL1501270.1 lysozyme inhibitor LprI family protein [Xanthomonas nasturtii]MCL1505077.1 lysozyme inhibitor LprI family protein [Xanthomonas nasturtii]MCL1524728.1 lysozyme inhibitor LprI family protein [Xanthomonas nasturtii]MCL1552853.1 lysozyme inhibitor LprI family protein [Xanthomonas nasturtii]MCL1557011.1 lysozyme inhibitor LprI family protein [Xanthomonas nasturtii]